MIYNDFPILSSDYYNNLNKQYYSSIKDRKHLAVVLHSQIRQCSYLCNSIKNVNPCIKQQLLNSKKTLLQLQENLLANFNIQPAEEKEMFEFNIFTFINKLFQVLQTTIIWLAEEEKIYYKTFINSTNSAIINIFCIFYIKNNIFL